ncbi:MAG: NosD domain-containing protein, partial [Thermoplasmatota archaeon]
LDLGYCDKITLKDNSLKNLNKSIRLISTTNSDIIGNTIIKNDRGIVLFNSNENTIFNNDIRLNDKEGIHILSSYNNIIGNNTIEENKDDGIEVSNSLTNLIKNNLFIKNKKYAIRSNNKSKMNLIYRNSFLWNNGAGIKYNTKHIQAYGNGQNLWNSSSQVGNYWRDWTSPDSNSNGIVDSPYLLDGNNARDYYPLTKSPTPLIPKVQNFDLKFESDKVKLLWNAPSEEGYLGIDEYWVYREDSSGKTYFIGNVSADQSTFNDNSLDEKGNYTYYVRGVNITEDEAEGSLPSKKLSIEYIPEENNDFSIYLITILVGVIGVAVVGVLIYRKIRKEDR